jgi:hypothetical protein
VSKNGTSFAAKAFNYFDYFDYFDYFNYFNYFDYICSPSREINLPFCVKNGKNATQTIMYVHVTLFRESKNDFRKKNVKNVNICLLFRKPLDDFGGKVVRPLLF